MPRAHRLTKTHSASLTLLLLSMLGGIGCSKISGSITRTGGTSQLLTSPQNSTVSITLADGTEALSVSESSLLTWTTTGPSALVSHYEVCIGNTNADCDIQDWTNVGTNTSYVASQLNLTRGQSYFARVRAVLVSGAKSDVATHDGFSVPMYWSRSSSYSPTFAPNSYNGSNVVKDILIASDGYRYIGGEMNNDSGTPVGGIAKLNADGTLDSSFASVGAGKGFAGTPMAIVQESSGKFIVGGDVRSYNGYRCPRICRLNADGTIDSTYRVHPLGFSDIITDLTVLPSGKLLVLGRFFTYGGTTQPYIARLNSDGTLDTSFIGPGQGLEPGEWFSKMKVQADGKIVVIGSFTKFFADAAKHRILRLNADGSIDSSFVQTGSGITSTGTFNMNVVGIQADGKIIVGGRFTHYNGVARQNVMRLNTDGSLDTGYTVGTGFTWDVFSLSILADGRALFTGDFSQYNGSSALRVAMLNSDGTIDATYPSAPVAGARDFYNHIIHSDGKVTFLGPLNNTYDSPDMARVDASGGRDMTFFPTPYQVFGRTGPSAGLPLPNGKLLVIGSFTAYGAPSAKKFLTKLDSTNQLVANWANGLSGPNDTVATLAEQADGKILIAGEFTAVNGTNISRIARITTAGALDGGFTVGTGFSGGTGPTKIIVQPGNQKIIVAGTFTSFDGVAAAKYLVRLNTDGSRDTNFNLTGTGFNGVVNDVALDANGKLLVAGAFTTYDNVSAPHLIRLNADGTRDATFNLAGTGLSYGLTRVALQSTGKIIIAGGFGDYNGVANTTGIARLNADGTLDATFQPVLSGDRYYWPDRMIVLPNDKIIISGYIYDNVDYDYSLSIFRLLAADGSLDSSKSTADNTVTQVKVIRAVSNTTLLLGGGFNMFGNQSTPRFVQID